MSAGMNGMDARRTMPAWLAIGFLVLTASGCARPDWIEQTLVTVDVTGVWRGSWTMPTASGIFELTLQQTGPKVTGEMRFAATQIYNPSGPITGTVSGDEMSGKGGKSPR